MKDVAARAGVSAATVSRVLAGDPSVSQRHRARALLAVEELNYRPNGIARSLRRRRTDTIGVVVSDIENPHFTRAVRTIENAAFRRGYRVVLCNTDETVEKQRAYLEVLAAEQVVGVILVPADPSDPTISTLLDMGVPVVAMDRTVHDQRADAVLANNADAARMATEHLISLDRRHIGFIAGRLEIQTGADRLAGYRAAMRGHDLTAAVGYGEFRLELAQWATRELLDDHPHLDGLIVANNLMVIGALRALRDTGRRIPDDIALVGIDDPPWAEVIDPPLTTFSQPTQQMAESAFALLVDRMKEQGTQPKHVIYQFERQIRRSCGFESVSTRL